MISYKIIDDTFPDRPKRNGHLRLLESNQQNDIAILRKEGLLDKLIAYRDKKNKRKDKLSSLMLFYSADKIEGFSDLSEEEKKAKCKEDIAKKLRINQEGGLKYKQYSGDYAGLVVIPMLSNGTYRAAISTSDLFAQNPNLVSDKEKAATSEKQASPVAPQTSKSNPTASNKNFAFTSKTEASVIYRISDLPIMATAASVLLRDIKERIDYFKIKLDTPINILYQSGIINQLPTAVDYILSNSFKNNEYNSQDYIKLSFAAETFEFMGFLLVKARPDGGYEATGKPLTQSQQVGVLDYFKRSSTTNSIVYNLSTIYNKYNSRIKIEGSNVHVPGTLFYSSDSVRSFLNSYIHPKTSLVTSEITRDIVERFILGDVRILDDEFFKNYRVSREQFNDSIKAEMQSEISKQYEAIGDMLGDAWLSGKFEQINTVDDFYESLLNYISIPDLISLSAKCLLKLIPLEELLDLICEPVLKRFDEHKEAIIQELESMEDGVAKDLATELKEIYFNRILGEQLEQNLAQGLVAETISNAGTLIQEANVLISWQYKGPLSILIGDFLRDYKTAQNVRGGALLGIETIPASNLENRRQQTIDRVEELKKEQVKLNEQLQVFQGQNIPENLQRLQTYYADEIKRLGNIPGGRLERLNRVIENSDNLLELYSILTREVLPALTALDPYLKQSEIDEIRVDHSENELFSTFPASLEEAINTLNQVTIPDNIRFKYGVEIQENPFNFSSGYPNAGLSAKKQQFDINTNTGLKAMYDIIRKISFSEEFESPADYLTELEDFGVKLLDETLEQLFQDETKRYYLCLAIYAAVPAVGYLIYLLITEADQVGEFLEEQYETIKKAFSRRIELFLPANFPVLDILKEIAEQLKQIGLNLARDLIVNGAMLLIRQLASVCSDEEKTNAPFNPIGAIDLSEFIQNTKTNSSGETVDLEDCSSFSDLSLLDPTFTLAQYGAVLGAFSTNFTINEITSMLNGFAEESLYQKALDLINSLTPNPISKNSNFYKYYSNTVGIRELMSQIAKDIDPAMLARARREFRQQKAILLDICFGNNDDILASTLTGLNSDEILNALAANNATRLELIPGLLDLSNALFQPASTTPCGSGEGILSEAQKFTAREVGKSIFDNAEKRTERAITSVKNVFLDTKQSINNYRSIFPNAGEENNSVNSVELILNNKDKVRSFQNQNKFVAKKIISQAENDIADSLGFAVSEEGIIFQYTNEKVDKSINFNFNNNELNFEFSVTEEEAETPENLGNIASYSKKQYFDEEIFMDTEPRQILFKQTTGVINQPDIDIEIKNALSEVLLSANNDTYVILLNSIFEDIFKFSFKTGLFLRQNFNKLNLKKHITKTTQLGQDTCFLGFMNSEVLTKQTINLAEKLKCYAPNSATQTPVNVSFIKLLFDAFIRSVALQEVMKSFFVFGVFPRDLIGDQITPSNNSIYEQIIKLETSQAFQKAFNSPSFPYSTFYDEVFRTFILDITRVIFQNQELTEDQAYSFVINSQIQFIKDQFKKAFFNAFGNSDSVIGQTEYQLLQEQSPSQELTEENNPLFNVNDTEIAYSEKLRAIQNDILAAYYDKTISVSQAEVLFGGDTIQPEAPAEEDEFQLQPTTLDFSSKVPVFIRDTATNFISPPGNGLILDKFININLKQTAFTQQQKQFFELVLIFLGQGVANSVATGNGSGMPPLKKLKMLLLETKFFMFFPQAMSFIDSLSDKFYVPANGEFPIYRQYVDEFGDFNLFYWVFKMNYEEDFFNNQTSLNWYNKMVSSGLWNRLNLGLMGKIRLSDFTLLTDKFLYPSSNISLGSNQFLNQEQINEEEKPEPLDTVVYLSNLFNNGFPTIAPRLKEFYEYMALGGDEFDNLLLLNLDKPLGIFDNQNLFAWIYFKKINDLFDITTTIRLDLKLTEEASFPLTNGLANQLFIGADSKQAKIQQSLLKEKIGPEVLLPNSFKFSSPMYELNSAFPNNVSWYDFLINIDKDSYFNDDSFYDLSDDLVGSATSINSFLFSNNKKDIFSYFNKLKVYSTTSQKQTQVIAKYQYSSTYFWNIKGVVYTLQDIISVIYGNKELEGGGKNINDVLEALTANSKNSFVMSYEQAAAEDLIAQSTSTKLYVKNLPPLEYKQLFIDVIVSTIQDNVDNESATQLTDAAVLQFDLESGNLKNGIIPFIEIKDDYNYGWAKSESGKGNAEELNKQFFGSDFDTTQYAGGPAYIFDPTTPMKQPGGPTLHRKAPFVMRYDSMSSEIKGILTTFTQTEFEYYQAFIKGGINSVELQYLEKPISSSKINIYDLFGKMLKDPEDKKVFNRLLQSLFLVEQTTIVALLHKIYTEQNYPEINAVFSPVIQNALKDLTASIAAVNGDYQHSSKDNVLTGEEFASAFGDVGLGLLKAFLGGIASTVDPTWKTPWLLPGPFTPFGIAAKLLEEDFDEDKEGPVQQPEDKAPAEEVCEDSLKQSSDFFSNFIELYKEVLSGQNNN